MIFRRRLKPNNSKDGRQFEWKGMRGLYIYRDFDGYQEQTINIGTSGLGSLYFSINRLKLGLFWDKWKVDIQANGGTPQVKNARWKVKCLEDLPPTVFKEVESIIHACNKEPERMSSYTNEQNHEVERILARKSNLKVIK